jgi:hypothetical protein
MRTGATFEPGNIDYALGSDDPYAMIKLLLQAGININAKDERGRTPLHRAAGGQFWGGAYAKLDDVIRALVKAGAKVDERDPDNNTPLHEAAAAGRTDAIKALVKAGADIHAKDSNGDTPLHKAAYYGQAYHGQKNAASMLLELGADPTIKNNKGQTPVDLAKEQGNKAVIKIIMGSKWAKRLLKGQKGYITIEVPGEPARTVALPPDIYIQILEWKEIAERQEPRKNP